MFIPFFQQPENSIINGQIDMKLCIFAIRNTVLFRKMLSGLQPLQCEHAFILLALFAGMQYEL